jgi:hypothetical protein
MAKDNQTIVSRNLTSNLGLPLIGIMRRQMEPYFVNAYLYDQNLGLQEDSPYGNEHIFLLLKFDGGNHYSKVEKYLEDLAHFKASYDIVNGGFVMYIFECIDFLKADYKRYIEGKYSEFSKDARDIIIPNLTPNGTPIKILRKDSSLKEYQENRIGESIGEQEVWTIPETSTEHFSEDVLKDIIHQYKMKGYVLS